MNILSIMNFIILTIDFILLIYNEMKSRKTIRFLKWENDFLIQRLTKKVVNEKEGE